MKFDAKDPDISTLIRRIDRGRIDLQPDFQRGEVWSRPKKQRLIDSILRGWHVPPIHLVKRPNGTYDVLDGQQRLTAIRDFVEGQFPVKGDIEPWDQRIGALGGLRYARLPEDVREEFDAFAIRVFELRDYNPDEPHELFFRLNQPTSLTEAEKRNAFMGDSRNQVRELVGWAVEEGMTPDRVGFSNARMSYDDLLARFLLTLERGTLTLKVTSAQVTARYREQRPFDDVLIAKAQNALSFVLDLGFLSEDSAKPNKATMHTWLCMAAELEHRNSLGRSSELLAEAIEWIEGSRLARRPVDKEFALPLSVFDNRATARVADAASVVLRDLTAWMIATRLRSDWPPLSDAATFSRAWEILEMAEEPERDLLNFANEGAWGAKGWL